MRFAKPIADLGFNILFFICVISILFYLNYMVGSNTEKIEIQQKKIEQNKQTIEKLQKENNRYQDFELVRIRR